MPAEPIVTTDAVTDIMPAGDAGTQRDTLGFQPELNGATYKDIPFDVDASTFRVEALTEWTQASDSGQPDIDYQLLGPDGQVVAESGNGVGPEFVSLTVTRPGTYTHRVIGFSNAATEFTVTTTLTKGTPPPTLAPAETEFVDAEGRRVDFDGAFTLSWQGAGVERGYEVERSSDGGQNWELIAGLGADATSLALAGQPDGAQQYRVRALTPGKIGFYVTPAGAPQSVLVDRRTLADITNAVQTSMSNVTFANGVFQLDLNMTNATAGAFLPRVELRVVSVNSASGTVRVANADNGGAGTPASPALFDYTNSLGADQTFAAGETTAARTLRFSDPRAELFTYDIQVTAYRRTSGAGDGGSTAAAPSGGGSGGGGTAPSGISPTSLLRVTANPLTKSVSVKLVGALK
jgi:hypothetical protein